MRNLQNDLFETMNLDALEAENAPQLDVTIELLAVISRILQNSSLGRDRIRDRINLCLRDSDREVTKIQFNKWLSPSQANDIPAWVLPALAWAVQSDAAFNALLQPIGRKVVDVRGDFIREHTERRLKASAELQEADRIEKQMMNMYNKPQGSF